MTQSLRDQLLGLGFKAPPKPEPKPKPPTTQNRSNARSGGGKPSQNAPKQGEPRRGGNVRPGSHKPKPPRSREEIDLAKAYAIRAQREKEERIAAEAAKQEAARVRREARAKLTAFLEGKALNDKDADIARHFEYGGKIKRIYVNADQLKALNAGELGVVQSNGRYVLVAAAVLDEAEALFPPAVALRVDPNASAADDPYADPQYQVPDDLVW